MRISKITLFAGTGLSAFLLAQPALAQDASGSTPQAASGAAPQADASAPTPAQGTDGGDIVVLGFGKSRQVTSITAKDMEVIVPGASPLKAIEKLPGVNFQSADAFGNYEWAVRISLRGFDQSRLGFTLDGIPLGTMGYATVEIWAAPKWHRAPARSALRRPVIWAARSSISAIRPRTRWP
jgi:iron complex outermembrane receptor protein